MSTIDLRNKIDSILGNSMRVLLPSYWWKRAFNVTADAIDTIETDTQEKIGEVQQQVDKLAEKMTEKRVLYADNPQDHKEENLAMINTLWGEHLFGRGHDPVYLVTEDGVWLSPNFTVQSNHIYFYNVPRKNTTGTTRQKLYTYHIYDKAGGEVVIEISDSFEHYVNQSSQNAVQSSAVYTAMQTKQDKLVSGSNIKTVNGQSILGAGNITIEGGSNITVDTSLSSTSTNAVQNKVVTAELAKKQDVLVSGETIKTINGQSIIGEGDITIEAGNNITVDTSLSSSSTNPVQNKVVKKALEAKKNVVVLDVDSDNLENLILEVLETEDSYLEVEPERFEEIFGSFMRDNFNNQLATTDIIIWENQYEPPYWYISDRYFYNSEFGIEFAKKEFDIGARNFVCTRMELSIDKTYDDFYYYVAVKRWIEPEHGIEYATKDEMDATKKEIESSNKVIAFALDDFDTKIKELTAEIEALKAASGESSNI